MFLNIQGSNLLIFLGDGSLSGNVIRLRGLGLGAVVRHNRRSDRHISQVGESSQNQVSKLKLPSYLYKHY